jgi:hypothetical protein
MRAETRTVVQIEANKLDLMLFNCAESIRAFAKAHKQDELIFVADALMGERWSVRNLMHPKDREATK